MANNQLGELRRSSVVMTFGPGAVVDFRADGAPVSAAVAGLEEWDRSTTKKGLTNPQTINEPRLEKKLGVKGFRLPPVEDEFKDHSKTENYTQKLVAVRFPTWLQCPRCDRLAPASRWMDEPGRAYRYCAPCTIKASGQKKVFAIPVRFVVACANGHLDDFPWHKWVNHRTDCKKKEKSDLYLRSEKAGLAGLILSCKECQARRSMDGIFSKRMSEYFLHCTRRKPWLGVKDESCDCKPRALQRGASNLYFPVIDSAISIPPWSDVVQEAIGVNWQPLVDISNSEDRTIFIRVLAHDVLKHVLEELGMSPEELSKHIEDRLKQYNENSMSDIRQAEYQQLFHGADGAAIHDREFEVRNVALPDSLSHYFSKIVQVVRLREVRALKGFTRINPPGDEESPNIASISVGRLNWLPAIEVRGEGIFLAFNKSTLEDWETQRSVVDRAREVQRRLQNEWRQFYGNSEPPLQITPRYLLVHTFAHVLIRQLTLECGYSTAALRERLYVSDCGEGMSGLLIYTSSPDSDGTLGGLQRQGETHRISQIILAAIGSMEWCSSDPLCIEGMVAGASSLSLASCHSCVFAPETSCEEFNRFLDRAMLVGLPNSSQVGYFSSLL